MKAKLIRTNGEFPPSGYAFMDGITGKQYNDLHTSFDERVRQIINDRNANRRMFTDSRRVDFDHVATELSIYTCERLNNDQRFCDYQPPPVTVTAPNGATVNYTPGKICRNCGSQDVAEILCATCGGHKVIGWKCRACNHEMTR